MNKIKNIYISYWFHELSDNPSSKVLALEEEIKSIIDEPIMYNEDNSHTNLSIPRLQGMSKDKKYLFTMSLINAVLSINVIDDISVDDVILLINNNIQLFYDIIRRVYGIEIVYTSIKIEMIDEAKNVKNKLIKQMNLSKKDYENISFKRGFVKDNYYINYILECAQEYNFNFDNGNNLSEVDLFDKTMVTSLLDAKLNSEYMLTVVEINNRYAYNKNRDYITNKDDLRGMIIELKDILNNKLYNEM